MIDVHFFAAARAAAQQSTQAIEFSALAEHSPQVADLIQFLTRTHTGRTPSGLSLGQVLEQCSFLLNGSRAEADSPITDGDRVDVLPPFAGG